MQIEPANIYVVDDDSGHTRLIEKNLRRQHIKNPIDAFSNGAEMLARISNAEPPNQPLLVLLDLNMPGLSGQRVLKELKLNEHTKSVPVIIMTSSDSPTEMHQCYALGCDLFLTKPLQYERFADTVQQLGLVLQVEETPTEA